jgi:hypothetical protein
VPSDQNRRGHLPVQGALEATPAGARQHSGRLSLIVSTCQPRTRSCVRSPSQLRRSLALSSSLTMGQLISLSRQPILLEDSPNDQNVAKLPARPAAYPTLTPLHELQQAFLDLRLTMFLHFNMATFQDLGMHDFAVILPADKPYYSHLAPRVGRRPSTHRAFQSNRPRLRPVGGRCSESEHEGCFLDHESAYAES